MVRVRPSMVKWSLFVPLASGILITSCAQEFCNLSIRVLALCQHIRLLARDVVLAELGILANQLHELLLAFVAVALQRHRLTMAATCV